MALSPDDRGILLRDWAQLRLHIRFSFCIKLSFWKQLPWIVFGLAHHVPAKARLCGRRALALARVVDPATLITIVRVIRYPPGTAYEEIPCCGICEKKKRLRGDVFILCRCAITYRVAGFALCRRTL